MYIPNRAPKLSYFSPFECGYKTSGWRWYYNFITHYKDKEINIHIESDMWDCLIQHGTVTC